MDDESAHQRLYAALRRELVECPRGPDSRISPVRLADAHRVSVTPVREALFRLVGEGIAVLHADGGFALADLDASRLADLHAWSGHHVLAALHLLPERRVAQIVDRAAAGGDRDHAAVVRALELLFASIARSTGNAEFLLRVDAANDRLRRARLVEDRLFPDTAREFGTIVRRVVSDAKGNVRRRIHAYHRRRVEHAGQIAAMLAGS